MLFAEEEEKEQARMKALEKEEPLLMETNNRFTLFPIRYNEVRRRVNTGAGDIRRTRADLAGLQEGPGELLDGCAKRYLHLESA